MVARIRNMRRESLLVLRKHICCEPNIGQSENISIDKKKKREKTKLRPKLNYNNRDTKDIELMEDISNDINNVKIVNNVQNARTIGDKIDIIQDDDEWKGKILGELL